MKKPRETLAWCVKTARGRLDVSTVSAHKGYAEYCRNTDKDRIVRVRIVEVVK